MDHQIQNLYERAQKLYRRVQNSAESQNDLFIDMVDCAYNLQQIKISVNYRRNNSVLTKEEQTAIEEIIEMAANTEQIIKGM